MINLVIWARFDYFRINGISKNRDFGPSDKWYLKFRINAMSDKWDVGKLGWPMRIGNLGFLKNIYDIVTRNRSSYVYNFVWLYLKLSVACLYHEPFGLDKFCISQINKPLKPGSYINEIVCTLKIGPKYNN